MTRRSWKWVMPVLLVAVGVLVAWALVASKPDVPEQSGPSPAPLVTVVPATAGDLRLDVISQGSVMAASGSELAAQVAGRVEWVAPALRAGGTFAADDVLLRIDPRDYELAVVRAESAVAQADLQVALEENEAAVALSEWALVGEGDPDPLVTREPQLRGARAAAAAARAELQRAHLDLERTAVRAPYDGRVQSRAVDIGQYVTVGAPLARVYALEAMEVRLPVPDAELAFLELPWPGATDGPAGPAVVLSADFAGRRWSWDGRIVRMESEIDPLTRMLHLVARVERPFTDAADGRPPLTPGLFVEARIHGREVSGLVVLPRPALREDDRVLVVDDDDRLRVREVEVLRAERGRVVLADGLAPGERVVVSLLEVTTDGMRVRPSDAEGRAGPPDPDAP